MLVPLWSVLLVMALVGHITTAVAAFHHFDSVHRTRRIAYLCLCLIPGSFLVFWFARWAAAAWEWVR